ncbi:MAG TPA: Xaa-Pro peptidase family protein [Candidatus Acidoferrales bacterium]|nr:Xaa-Pro peptidase family protein [Candidatus Acidoferrales bacterium]
MARQLGKAAKTSETAGAAGSAARLSFLQQQFEAERLDAFVVSHLPNVFYLSGFTGSSGILLVTPQDAALFTDSRYTVQAADEVHEARVHIVRGSLLNAVGERLARLRARGNVRRSSHKNVRRVGFEAARLTVLQKHALDKAAGAKVRWLPWDGKIEAARAVKDADELRIMREAADIACSSWQEILPLVKPGIRENELAAELEFRMRRKGASGPAFDTIVASGPRGALPHAHASPRAIGKNELVVFDLGAILRGYSSDLTRTVFVGRAPAEIRRWYAAVLQAQQAARDALRPGVSAHQVDAAARQALRRAALDKKFVHSTGHGLGLEVHEMPRLGRGEKSILRAGMVVTLEPGVYVEGTGGIRIEDDALVTQTGAEYLTCANRELIELE